MLHLHNLDTVVVFKGLSLFPYYEQQFSQSKMAISTKIAWVDSGDGKSKKIENAECLAFFFYMDR